MRDAGLIVKTASGRRGHTLNKNSRVNGKVIVYIYKADTLEYETGEDGQPLKMLCRPEGLELIGYLN